MREKNGDFSVQKLSADLKKILVKIHVLRLHRTAAAWHVCTDLRFLWFQTIHMAQPSLFTTQNANRQKMKVIASVNRFIKGGAQNRYFLISVRSYFYFRTFIHFYIALFLECLEFIQIRMETLR